MESSREKVNNWNRVDQVRKIFIHGAGFLFLRIWVFVFFASTEKLRFALIILFFSPLIQTLPN